MRYIKCFFTYYVHACTVSHKMSRIILSETFLVVKYQSLYCKYELATFFMLIRPYEQSRYRDTNEKFKYCPTVV